MRAKMNLAPLITLVRVAVVGILWSIFFFEGIRVILLVNWHFDTLRPAHWLYAWNLWNSGWVIDDAKEWAFVLIIASFVPLWLCGWAFLGMVPFERHLRQAAAWGLVQFRRLLCPCRNAAPRVELPAYKTVVKRKSYKEIRPRDLRSGPAASAPIAPVPAVGPPIAGTVAAAPAVAALPATVAPAAAASAAVAAVRAKAASPVSAPASAAAPVAAPKEFTHSLFSSLGDEEEDGGGGFDFDMFEEKPKPAPAPVPAPVAEPKAESKPREEARKPREDRDNRDRDGRDKKKPRREDKREDRRDNRDNRDSKRAPREDRKEAPASAHAQAPVSAPAAPVAGGGNASTVFDIIVQHGYQVVNGATIKDHFIDFIGVADGEAIVFLCDKEAGDWLADEERFNDEEPLWFSETSHRISPVRKAAIAAEAVRARLAAQDLAFNISAYVVIGHGNVINAEDMFEPWRETGVKVTRIGRGSPREIPLFAKSLDNAPGKISPEKFEKIKKLVRNI